MNKLDKLKKKYNKLQAEIDKEFDIDKFMKLVELGDEIERLEK